MFARPKNRRQKARRLLFRQSIPAQFCVINVRTGCRTARPRGDSISIHGTVYMCACQLKGVRHMSSGVASTWLRSSLTLSNLLREFVKNVVMMTVPLNSRRVSLMSLVPFGMHLLTLSNLRDTEARLQCGGLARIPTTFSTAILRPYDCLSHPL